MNVTQPSKYCDHLFHNASPTKLWLEGLDIHSEKNQPEVTTVTQKIIIEENLINYLFQLKKHIKVPISVLFQAAWGLLINRFSGTNSVFYGLRSSSNEYILPIRSKLRNEDDILTYIIKLYKQQKKTNAHSEEILKKLNSDTKFKNLLHYLIDFNDNFELHNELNEFPFILKIKNQIELEIIADSRKFSEDSINNLSTHYVQILTKITQDSHQSVTHFSILTANEKKILLNEWNRSSYQSRPIDHTQLIHEKVKYHAKNNPQNTAITYNENFLTYQEINDLSDKLATFLIKEGIQSQSVVAVLMERTPALIITMLAIFKVGAIYVPINLKYPEDRIKYILNDCQANVFLASNKQYIPVEFLNKAHFIDDQFDILKSIQDETAPPFSTDLENIAYIMYTSGTTGFPKGVMIKQISLINLSMWYEICFALSKEDKVSQFASQAFDSYFCETMPALFSGASIHIIDDNKKLIPTEFLAWLEEQKITICDLPTAYALIILNLSNNNSHLRHLKLGGESLSYYPEKTFNFNIWNTYGPTEATVETTYIKIYDPLIGQTHTKVPPPIGKPLINAEVYIVDKHLELVSIGNVGELLIGGLGVAAGYLNRAQLTKEKFINNYYSDLNTKLYRTGDLVRWLPDGNLEFMGRVDHQVKIRGYRIELNEIKSIIEQYPDVGEVVVLVKELPNSQKTLAAYLVHDLDKIRIPYQQKCLISIDNQYKEIFSDDISKRGIAINGIHEKLELGQPVSINILLPGNTDTSWLDGTVIWQMDQRAGIQFNDTPKQNKMLENIIEYFLSNHNLMETLQSVASNRNLREALKKKLPDYMIPSSFTVMPKFPLTFNGKIDWKALPPPKDFENLLERNYVPPRTKTEKEVTAIWQEILNLKKISMNDNFFDLGGNSLQVSELSVKLLEKFHISIPVKIFIDLPFIPIISEFIDSKGKSYTNTSSIQETINHDAILNEDILPTKKIKENLNNPRSILLTGVSGFLGIHLLRELLATTHAKIYCLIRKTDHDNITQRFLTNLKRYKIENDIHMPNPRIILLEGDVGQAQLGLTGKQYNDLASEIDIICHCAAQVNMIASYSTLRQSNVLGTLEVIKFATHIIDKPIHHISTLSAAHQKDKYGQFTEEFPNANSSNLVGGYAVSKWIAERLLTEIKNRGLPVSIYRCGYILGQSDTGIVNINEALLFLIKGCIQLGIAPEWSEKVTFLPVDFVSQAIVEIMLNFPTKSEVYNLDHPGGISWIDLITWLNYYGYEIKFCSHYDWLQKLLHITPENALYSLLPQYLAEPKEIRTPEPSMRNTEHAFQQMRLSFPKLDDHLLRIYMKFLRETGFVPDPYTEKEQT